MTQAFFKLIELSLLLVVSCVDGVTQAFFKWRTDPGLVAFACGGVVCCPSFTSCVCDFFFFNCVSVVQRQIQVVCVPSFPLLFLIFPCFAFLALFTFLVCFPCFHFLALLCFAFAFLCFPLLSFLSFPCFAFLFLL